MREAVIVSTARTPIGKAYRGTPHDTARRHLAAHPLIGTLAGPNGDYAEVAAACRDLGPDSDKVDINCGATAIGPPDGDAVVTMSVGGGMGAARFEAAS